MSQVAALGRSLVVSATAVSLSIAVGVWPSSASTGAPKAGSVRSLPHNGSVNVGWNSGVFPGNGIDLAAARSFAIYRHRHLDNVHVFPDATSWAQIANGAWEVRQYSGFKKPLVIDTPLLPTSGGGTLSQVAKGADDTYFRTMARRLVALGRGNSILVLGSEFNGNWQSYSAFNPSAYVAAFRRVSELLKAVSSSFQIDWVGNAVDNQAGHDPFVADYPGNDVVDLIGVDAYDYVDWDIAEDGFARWQNQPFGLSDWLRFARAHDKPFSVPEWGLTVSSGDDPTYVRGMFEFFQRNARSLAFEDYFDEPHDTTHDSLSGPDELPQSSAVYARLWSGVPAPPGPQRSVVRHMTLRLSPRSARIHRGQHVLLRGRVTPTTGAPHRRVAVYMRRPGKGAWEAMEILRTRAMGRFSLSVRPLVSTVYRVLLPMARSTPPAVSRVRVRPN